MSVPTCTSQIQEDLVAGEDVGCLQHATKGRCRMLAACYQGVSESFDVQGSHAEAVMHAQVKREHQSEGKSFRDILLGGP